MNDSIITDNLKLVRFVMKRYFNNTHDEDLFQIGCLGLVKAAKAFDENKGFNFSTFAIKVITNEFFMLSRKKETCTVSFEESVGDGLILSDTLADSNNLYARVEICEIYNKALKSFNLRDKNIIQKYLKIKDQKIIAKIYGISQGQASRIISSFREKVDKIYKEGV